MTSITTTSPHIWICHFMLLKRSTIEILSQTIGQKKVFQRQSKKRKSLSNIKIIKEIIHHWLAIDCYRTYILQDGKTLTKKNFKK